MQKKRNFKALTLAEEPLLPPAGQENLAPRSINKRKFPGEHGSPRRSPLSLLITPTTYKHRPDGLLGLTPESAHRSALYASLSTKLAALEITGSWEYLRSDDFRVLGEIGYGTGGSVYKVEHIPSGKVLARKGVIVEGNPNTRVGRKQLLLELQLAHGSTSPYLVSSYGAYLECPALMICMEYMDLGSFDRLSKKLGQLDVGVVAHVANSVLRALLYLSEEYNVIHRDVKPSNILLNSKGEIKLCDFGVCEEMGHGDKLTSFVGTSVYMSPERMQGIPYTIKSDVWSLGLTFIELAHGRSPFADPMISSPISRPGSRILSPISGLRSAKATPITSSEQLCIIELMHQIVAEPPPVLNPSRFSVDAQNFVRSCLEKDVGLRLSPCELLANSWLSDTVAQTDLAAWAQTISDSF